MDTHRRLLEGRERTIPGWYEITFEDAVRLRQTYMPLDEPKLVVDAVDGLPANLAKVQGFLGIAEQ